MLQQIAAYNKHPLLPASGSILAAMAAAAPAAAGSSGSSAAIVSLPGHADIEHSALAKSCCCCNKHEGQEVSNLATTWVEMHRIFLQTCRADAALPHLGTLNKMGPRLLTTGHVYAEGSTVC